MPTVTLSREWTDLQGNAHLAGSVLRVDDVTAARLQADGYLGALGGEAAQAQNGVSGEDKAEWKSPSAQREDWKSPSAQREDWKSPSAQREDWKSPSAVADEPADADGNDQNPPPADAEAQTVWKSPSGTP
jgi:hypothetical protein